MAAPDAVIFVLLPLQIADETGVMVITGTALTTMLCVLVPEQPSAVPVIVYIVVEDGVQFTSAPVVVFSPVAGDQKYVDAPVAVIVVVDPLQIAGEPAVTVNEGNGVTFMVTVEVPIQPEAAPLTV